MTFLQLTSELGNTAVLEARDGSLPPSPWLLKVEDSLKLYEIELLQLVLRENGAVKLITSEEFGWNIPKFSFITPMLTPIARNLEDSIKYELDLFLDRLDKCELPEFFGLLYNPAYPITYLEELLSYEPSIIGIQIENIMDMRVEQLITLILDIRERIPRDIALYIPGGVEIGMQTLLIALGVDILDETSAYIATAKQMHFTDGFIEKYSDLPIEILLDDNLRELRRDFAGITVSIRNNQLWSRLAREMHVTPRIASAVTLLNHNFLHQMQLAKFPRGRPNKIYFTGEEGLYHPEIMIYRKRVELRYSVPTSKKAVLLLPCSARKPYRNSKSHTQFEKAIGSAIRHKRDLLEIWSLTSPLGVVPRTIETQYPAANYDIPVTGHWSQEEIEITGNMLLNMLSNLPADIPVIAHVSEGYRGMIEFANRNSKISTMWIGERPTGEKALLTLQENLQNIFDDMIIDTKREKSLYKIAKRDIPGLLQYVHGKEAQLNLDEIKIVGRPPRPIQVQKNGDHYITWDVLTGETRLSPEAALELARKTSNWIILDAERLSGSSIYAAGILDASEEISPGDEVIIFNSDKTRLIGIGSAIISGKTMKTLKYGRVAKLRRKTNKEVV